MADYAKMTYAMLYTTALCFVASVASAQTLSGEYVSLDGKIQHNFKPSGDYSVKVLNGKKWLSASGVFQLGSELCWKANSNGSKGEVGNVLVFIGDAQCCYQFREISDKFAVTLIWVRRAVIPMSQFCENQVLTKKKK